MIKASRFHVLKLGNESLQQIRSVSLLKTKFSCASQPFLVSFIFCLNLSAGVADQESRAGVTEREGRELEKTGSCNRYNVLRSALSKH